MLQCRRSKTIHDDIYILFWQLVKNHASDYKLIKVKSANCKKMTLDVAFVIERQRFHTGHQLCKLATNIIIQEVNKLQPHISKMQLIFSYLDHVSLIFEKRRVNIYDRLTSFFDNTYKFSYKKSIS